MKRLWNLLSSVIRRFLAAHCSLHAAGLTYFSLLAVIPALCCMLVAAKACGVDRFARAQIDSRIDAAIENIENGQDDPLLRFTLRNEGAREIKQAAAETFARRARTVSHALFERINAFDIQTLGWIGFGFLLWTVISSLGMVEMSFNEIWNIQKQRPLWKRTYTYLFLIVVLPVLAATALSLPVLGIAKDIISATLGSSALTKGASDGLLWLLDSAFFRVGITLTSATLLFGFIFWMMPNARVAVKSALGGGLVTAALFGGWVRLCAVAQVGIAKSSALYGSFAILPIILTWLYMSWQIVLFGACFVESLERHKF